MFTSSFSAKEQYDSDDEKVCTTDFVERFDIFSFSFSRRVFPPILTDVVQNFLLFYSLIIHRRISITPRAENDSASTTTPAASAAPKLVPSNAASIKVNECIRLEKFWFFCFLDQNRFFLPLSLSWGDRVSLFPPSHNSRTTKVRRARVVDFLCRQRESFFVRVSRVHSTRE